ncbi:hypothetical protein K1T71_009634 [Dendrolimus kikuchii]|uniref:Uncharacterized protein n=1 Tax=Dendrolimus kikuchii TaxID=765133 RepID=A0ACC1CSA5_9NEOP|nr:hypothetical protein K1T71_009634 [Dendrolimus kikuchii]
MTRFARAKGSKASNERTADDSTPWEVMKEQLLKSKQENEEAKNREEAEKQRIENYENFLKEQKVQKRKATWCDFPETVNGLNNDNKESVTLKKKKKKNKQKTENTKEAGTTEGLTKINSINNVTDILQKNDIEETRHGKTKSKKEFIISKDHKKEVETNQNENSVEDQQELVNLTPKKKKKKKNKHNKTNSLSDNSVSTTVNTGPNSKELNEAVDTGHNNQIKPEKQKNKEKKRKNRKEKKLANGEPVRRKPLTVRSFQLIINGKEVELVRFDGFPIMKKDAERLEELKTSMVKKGIPKSEVQRTIKLERRRAEKALARLKRDVCYNCRKGGHNLSDCPELKSKIPGVDAPEGVCFKCGSTEHRQFECKVQRDKEFRFATCFICKEAGHIARQCPDNPKGLYPNGGCCKLCGDVTHLRKDCPTVKDKKEETSIKLQTLDSAENIEGIDQNIKSSSSEEPVKQPKKIKF